MHSVLDSDVVRTNFTDVYLHEITISLVKVLFTMMTSHTLFQNKNKGIFVKKSEPYFSDLQT